MGQLWLHCPAASWCLLLFQMQKGKVRLQLPVHHLDLQMEVQGYSRVQKNRSQTQLCPKCRCPALLRALGQTQPALAHQGTLPALGTIQPGTRKTELAHRPLQSTTAVS